MIIGISGVSGSGKDTLANMMLYNFIQLADPIRTAPSYKAYQFIAQAHQPNPITSYYTNWRIAKFASALTSFLSNVLQVSPGLFQDQAFKQSKLPAKWNLNDEPTTIRDLMIRVGDGLRNVAHPDFWINSLSLQSGMNYIFTDVRYPNEFAFIKKAGGFVYRVEREGLDSNFFVDHKLDDYVKEFTAIIVNNGSLENLFQSSIQLANEIYNQNLGPSK